MVARVPGALGRSLGRPWWLVATVALATMLRAAHVLSLRATPWFDHLVVDPEYYDEWARRIAAGDWLGDRPFYMDPLYPYFLGVIYRLCGRDLLLVRLVHVALQRADVLLLARLADLGLLPQRCAWGACGFGLPGRVTAALLFAAGFGLSLVPVALRNHHLSGLWILTTSQAGQIFFIGNNPA